MEFIFFGCGACLFLFACSQLLVKDKQALHYCMSISCFVLSYLLIYYWLAATGNLQRLPAALASSDISAVFLEVPAFYLASLGILYGGSPPIRNYVAYFIPSLIFAFAFGAYNGLATPASIQNLGTVRGHFESPLLTILTTLSCSTFPVALVLDLRAARRVRKTGMIPPGGVFRTQVVWLFIYLAFSLLLLAGCLLRSERLLAIGLAALGLAAVGFTLTCTTVLYFMHGSLAHPLRTAEARPDWDATADEFSGRLERLIRESAPYRSEELTLPQLARALGVEPRRLSYHFKTRCGTNFRGYINDLRLRAVCRDLLESPDSSILDLAFKNGFNSKSSFNMLFLKAYGLTPREFRSRGKDSLAGNGGESLPRRD